MRRHLNDLLIRQLPPGNPTYAVWDAGFPAGGLGLRIGTRVRTFVLKKDNRFYTLGRWPSISLKQAREEAHRRIALRYFPAPTPPIYSAVEEYLAFQKSRVRHGTMIQIHHHFRKHFPDVTAFPLLTHNVIHDALRNLTPSQQAHAYNLFKTFLNWCVERSYLAKSPLNGLKSPYRQVSRERVLSDTEMKQIIAATQENTPFNNIIQFCVFSAQRRTQVSLTRHAYITDNAITWPKEDMKSNCQHTMPLTPKLATLIQKSATDPLAFGETPFQAWSRAKRELDERLTIPHWTIHDLRRTARTNLARLSVPEPIAERVLAHAPPKLNRIYDRYLHLPAMADALLKLEFHYCSLGTKEE